jgi:hypothetical protein
LSGSLDSQISPILQGERLLFVAQLAANRRLAARCRIDRIVEQRVPLGSPSAPRGRGASRARGHAHQRRGRSIGCDPIACAASEVRALHTTNARWDIVAELGDSSNRSMPLRGIARSASEFGNQPAVVDAQGVKLPTMASEPGRP